MKTDNLTNRTVEKNLGRRKAGSYGKATSSRKAVANRATRRSAKTVLNVFANHAPNCS